MPITHRTYKRVMGYGPFRRTCQLVLPQPWCRALGITPGEVVAMELLAEPGQIVIRPLNTEERQAQTDLEGR